MNKALILTVAALLAQSAICGGDDDNAVPTTLTMIRSTPDAFKNVTVRFTVQFSTLGKVSNPFFTRFVPSDYANFYAWSADQPIWRKEAYDDVFGLLFIAKEHKNLPDLYRFKQYERLELVGTVKNVFQGMPWIDVTSWTPLAERVSTATLAHLYKGEAYMNRRQWQQAIAELSVAPGAGTPNEVQSAIHRNLGVCYLRIGEAGTAVSHLNSANSLMPGGDRESELLAQVALTKPQTELDRQVDSKGVKDTERPFWEAFEDVRPVQQNQSATPPTNR